MKQTTFTVMQNTFPPLVSIITPTYNQERFIRDCIQSVLKQTYANWEQIIIDDGSNDRTAKIVGDNQDRRIRYYHQDNLGIEALAHTYNRALNLSGGELVAILEGDDFWPNEKLSRMVPAFQDSEVVLAYGEMREADIDGRPARCMSRTAELRTELESRILNNDPPPAAAAHMLTVHGHSMIPASTVIIRRSALEAIGGFQYVPGLRYVDFPTFIRLVPLGKFCYCQDIVGYRRMHPSSATMRYREEMLRVSQRFRRALMGDSQYGLTCSDRENIEASWKSAECATEYLQGRLCLLSGQWKNARRHFRRALGVSNMRVSLGGASGWILSWLRRDLEGLYRVAGRAALTQIYDDAS